MNVFTMVEVKGDIGFLLNEVYYFNIATCGTYRIRNPKDVKEIAEPALVVVEYIKDNLADERYTAYMEQEVFDVVAVGREEVKVTYAEDYFKVYNYREILKDCRILERVEYRLFKLPL